MSENMTPDLSAVDETKPWAYGKAVGSKWILELAAERLSLSGGCKFMPRRGDLVTLSEDQMSCLKPMDSDLSTLTARAEQAEARARELDKELAREMKAAESEIVRLQGEYRDALDRAEKAEARLAELEGQQPVGGMPLFPPICDILSNNGISPCFAIARQICELVKPQPVPAQPAAILECAEGMAAYTHGSDGFNAYRARLCALLSVPVDTEVDSMKLTPMPVPAPASQPVNAIAEEIKEIARFLERGNFPVTSRDLFVIAAKLEGQADHIVDANKKVADHSPDAGKKVAVAGQGVVERLRGVMKAVEDAAFECGVHDCRASEADRLDATNAAFEAALQQIVTLPEPEQKPEYTITTINDKVVFRSTGEAHSYVTITLGDRAAMSLASSLIHHAALLAPSAAGEGAGRE